ncbi:uncharacterized protein TrAtP1_008555 [Trichoderma atroviride]|uniref:uncharacterized protein n=1 Tax=Hypocrea atroviridis TaxID=63577 RepID=UPI003331C701|nr:hypothetical protein TrAtP1_008555 [Trichoderma atroviride]
MKPTSITTLRSTSSRMTSMTPTRFTHKSRTMAKCPHMIRLPPQHHIPRPPNLEELQLAAQLGQGLAGTALIPATDPNMNVEDPSMRNIMPPEPDQHQTPSYVHEAPASEHMVTHTIPVPVGPPLPPQYSMGDGIPPPETIQGVSCLR